MTMLEGRDASCGGFLRELLPHLDEYEDRVQAGLMAEDMDLRARYGVTPSTEP
jgi:hypothetical protein